MAVLAVCFCTAASDDVQQDEFVEERRAMVARQLAARDITDKRVLAAMEKVPRHRFVNPAFRHLAYSDQALPIGNGQTISQPYIVALMSQWLQLEPGEKILEIGTGSGYQAAVLAHLTDAVYSIEIIAELGERAEGTLRSLGYDNVHIKIGDGHRGWPEEAPFDAMIITCATPEVPPLLFEQLREGGRIVLPLGDPRTYQTLTIVSKVDGKPKMKSISGVRFVPMTGKVIKEKK